MAKQNLKLVTEQDQPACAPRKDLNEWRLSPEEISNRVATIRADLEAARDRYRGTMFDILTEGATPRSMDTETAIREPYQLVNLLCPALEECFRRVGEDCNDNAVGYLQFTGMEVGFQIGLLAGLIFADADAQEIDRAVRGLVHASVARRF